MGKTTLCAAIMGITPPQIAAARSGSRARSSSASSSHKIARRGIGYVPQGRRLFPSLTRRRAPAHGSRARTAATAGRMSASTSSSRASPSGSGTAARSSPAASSRCSRSAARCCTNPKLLIMDEPSEGLAPTIIEKLIETFQQLEEEGLRDPPHRAEPRRRDLARRAAARDGRRRDRSRDDREASSRTTPSSSGATSASSRSRTRCLRSACRAARRARCARWSRAAAAASKPKGPAGAPLRQRQGRGLRDLRADADGKQHRLTEEQGDPSTPAGLLFQVEPAWSPDGDDDRLREQPRRHSAHLRDEGRRDGHATADETPARRRPPDVVGRRQRIVFAREGALYRVVGGTATRLSKGLRRLGRSGVSPDGKLIAFDYPRPGFSIKRDLRDERRRHRESQAHRSP